MKTSYRRKLPHHQPVGAIFFVTFRLFGSIPKSKVHELKSAYQLSLNTIEKLTDPKEKILQKRNLKLEYLEKNEQYLHKIQVGPNYFENAVLAQIIKAELFKYDGILYKLLCFSIMSNHVHILIDTSVQLKEEDVINNDFKDYISLDKILKRIKGSSAFKCNKYLNRKGQFWDRESFDIYIRQGKMIQQIITYILENPVKAGIVKEWSDYKWNYLSEG